MNLNNIRNFCIIAHIDHGKSTLADRLIEMTKTVSEREMKEQLLDNMELERERGITIKLQTVRMYYQAEDQAEYELNLIDTPGHTDFAYEVSRSLAACEGALLVIDATQGVQAQTIANLKLAQEQNLTIIPVINKIDMPNADVERVTKELEELDGINLDNIILASARTGAGVDNILNAIVKEIPAPSGEQNRPLQALIFDSHYDMYRGVVLHVRIFNGSVATGQKIKMIKSELEFEALQIGVFLPEMRSVETLVAGEVGYISTNIKVVSNVKVGDTLIDINAPDTPPVPGYKDVKPMVYAGLFPIKNEEQEKLRDAIEKLALNDSAFVYQQENSLALGSGFRCGFLGILHMEIIQERLEREHGIEIISTFPSVEYRVTLTNGQVITVNNPTLLPSFEKIASIEEPFIESAIIIPVENIGEIMNLCQEKRGIFVDMTYLNNKMAELFFKLPISEIAYTFFNSLKSITHGYASVDYRDRCYIASDLVKMDIWLNDEIVDAFSFILPRSSSFERGKQIALKMKHVIPRKLYPMPVQSVVENRVIAREDIPPLRKSVTGKGYSGSLSKKRKIAKNIKDNKVRQRKFGGVDIPQAAFHAVLDIS